VAKVATASKEFARRLSIPSSKNPSGSPTSAEDFAVYKNAEPWSIEDFRDRFHQLLYGEVETTDRMGQMLAEFPELPVGDAHGACPSMWDEARTYRDRGKGQSKMNSAVR
jgi:hypothetical protein